MALEKCTTCQPTIQCCSGGNVFFYSLVSGVVLSNDQTGFVFDCPVGFVCAPGQYPITIIIPPGTVTVPLPPSTFGPNPPPIIVPCPGGNIIAYIPPGSTREQIIDIGQQAVANCVKQIAPIRANPPPGQGPAQFTVYNNPQTITACDDPNTLTGFLPGPYSISGNDITISNGVVAVICHGSDPASIAACQAQADSQAFVLLADAIENGLDSGAISCSQPFGFGQLVWNNPANFSGGNLTVSSGSGSGNSANMQMATNISTGANGGIGTDGTLAYSGPALNCNLQVSVPVLVTNDSPDNNTTISVSVGFTDSSWTENFCLSAGAVLGCTSMVQGGVYNFPFTVPMTAGNFIQVGYGMQFSVDVAVKSMSSVITLTPD